jgi:hypothetical protein
MDTPIGHLAFCTNIFPGETWEEHFAALKKHVPGIMERLDTPVLGLGLRLSNKASLQLSQGDALGAFRKWLDSTGCRVFTMNGFPYGHFHRQKVKDAVHHPDWTTNERLQYTLRLSRILAALLPPGMEGSISTSPLSYKYWHDAAALDGVREKATWNLVEVIGHLHKTKVATGQILHVDVEPEADGLIENSAEFADWYENVLLPLGTALLQDRLSVSEGEAAAILREHLRLCYDVCHFAVGFETPSSVCSRLQSLGIRIGKWQLSSALRAEPGATAEQRRAVLAQLAKFDEPVYLHQVVTRQPDGQLTAYRDLSAALADPRARRAAEWRAHFHVPLFLGQYGLLSSTQQEVAAALRYQEQNLVSSHLEVETYTWDVLPAALKVPVAESIAREMDWVIRQIDHKTSFDA